MLQRKADYSLECIMNSIARMTVTSTLMVNRDKVGVSKSMHAIKLIKTTEGER